MTTQPSPSATTQSPAAFASRLVLGFVLINLFVWIMAALSAYHSHAQHQARAELTTRNLAHTLANDIAGSIRAEDIALRAVLDEYIRQRDSSGVNDVALNAYIERVRARLPEIDALRITDRHGMLIHGSGVTPGSRTSLADRRHFIQLRDHPGAELVISSPQISRVNQKWVIVLARRINAPDGSFDGMAFVAIDLQHLAQTFSRLNIGSRGMVSLHNAHQEVVTTYPERQAHGGAPTLPAALRALIVSGQDSADYRARLNGDTIERIFSSRQVGPYPLFVSVGLANDDYLDHWRGENIGLVAASALFALITLLSAVLIYRGWQRQRAALLALASQEAKFRTLADFTFDWEYWQGPQRDILYMTPSCERITGHAPAEFATDPDLLTRIIHPADQHLMQQHLHDLDEQDSALIDFRIVRRDGEIRWISHHCRAIRDEQGRPLGRRISNRDVTERRDAETALREKTEALQRSNADLEQFAYSVSHDMRQPLRAISGHLQLLQRSLKERLDPDDRENLSYALEGARRMDAMIVSLLEYSRVGRKTSAKTWMESRVSLDEAMGYLAPMVEESGGTLTLSGEWPRVYASRDELTRLFQNLVGNALKYHEPGQPPVIAIDSAVNAESWRVTVRDHGIGIEPDQADRLFQFFSRLQSRARFEGTGMGLALCRRIVEHHAGRIWVESTGSGQGSTFIFEIPLTLPDNGSEEPHLTSGEHHET